MYRGSCVGSHLGESVLERGVRCSAGKVGGGVGRQRHARQQRSQPVVQLAPEPTTLLLTGAHKPIAGELQLLEQSGGVHRGGQRPGEQREHALVGRVEPRFAPAKADDQRPSLKGQFGRRPNQHPAGREWLTIDHDAHKGQAERLRNLPQRLGQPSTERAANTGGDFQRVPALPIEQLVDPGLKP